MSVEISLWNLCNNNCVMCTNPDNFKDGKLINLKSIKKYLDRDDIRTKKNVRNVFVSGGETTIQPDFFNIISFIQDKYPLARLNILTNGRRFFYKEFCEACVAFGNVNFIIPVHSFDEETHDATTQIKGSFHQTMTGLKNLMRLRRTGQEVEVRIIITKLNYKKIPRIVDFIQKEIPQADRLVIIFLEYEGQAIKNFEDLKLSYDDFKPELKKIKPYLAGGKEIRLYHFPLCVAPYDIWPYLWRTLREDEVTFLSQCKNCVMKQFCLGIHKNYLKLFGKKEFKPIQKSYLLKASNNFHHPIEAVKRK